MEINKLFDGVYKGRKCLVTGDTGFKGSWLVAWLTQMGAEVVGYALAPNTHTNHKTLLKTEYKSIEGNILDSILLKSVFKDFQPEIVFHLAAQSLVKYSYENPVETYQTNVIGTLNGCAELLTQSYRKSFLDGDKNQILLASVRAGNVIGGGDWSQDRLIPDLIKATAEDKETEIRNPLATRPWQHVLEPLSGYLWLGVKLAENPETYHGNMY